MLIIYFFLRPIGFEPVQLREQVFFSFSFSASSTAQPGTVKIVL